MVVFGEGAECLVAVPHKEAVFICYFDYGYCGIICIAHAAVGIRPVKKSFGVIFLGLYKLGCEDVENFVIVAICFFEAKIAAVLSADVEIEIYVDAVFCKLVYEEIEPVKGLGIEFGWIVFIPDSRFLSERRLYPCGAF